MWEGGSSEEPRTQSREYRVRLPALRTTGRGRGPVGRAFPPLFLRPPHKGDHVCKSPASTKVGWLLLEENRWTHASRNEPMVVGLRKEPHRT